MECYSLRELWAKSKTVWARGDVERLVREYHVGTLAAEARLKRCNGTGLPN